MLWTNPICSTRASFVWYVRLYWLIVIIWAVNHLTNSPRKTLDVSRYSSQTSLSLKPIQLNQKKKTIQWFSSGNKKNTVVFYLNEIIYSLYLLLIFFPDIPALNLSAAPQEAGRAPATAEFIHQKEANVDGDDHQIQQEPAVQIPRKIAVAQRGHKATGGVLGEKSRSDFGGVLRFSPGFF